MNEIERIIQKGVLPESFFQEEVRDGFVVTTERKKLWGVMLDMLIEFDKICKKHNLTYFLWAGSLLGAIRHKGFIPWDDDMDVVMPRKDYEKFLELGDEFKSPYFFQTPYTDPEYFYSFAKIRNSNTTGVVELFKYQKINHGIWISIMPIDNWELEGGEERYKLIDSLIKDCSTYMRSTNPELSEANIARVKQFKERNIKPLDVYEEFFRITGQYKNVKTEYVAYDSCTILPYSKALYRAEDFKTALMWEVEGLKLPVPNGYDRILKTMYGDYMEFPPVEERGKWHDGTYFDTDISFKDFLRTNLTTK